MKDDGTRPRPVRDDPRNCPCDKPKGKPRKMKIVGGRALYVDEPEPEKSEGERSPESK